MKSVGERTVASIVERTTKWIFVSACIHRIKTAIAYVTNVMGIFTVVTVL